MILDRTAEAAASFAEEPTGNIWDTPPEEDEESDTCVLATAQKNKKI